jgi:hypothetical protein
MTTEEQKKPTLNPEQPSDILENKVMQPIPKKIAYHWYSGDVGNNIPVDDLREIIDVAFAHRPLGFETTIYTDDRKLIENSLKSICEKLHIDHDVILSRGILNIRNIFDKIESAKEENLWHTLNARSTTGHLVEAIEDTFRYEAYGSGTAKTTTSNIARLFTLYGNGGWHLDVDTRLKRDSSKIIPLPTDFTVPHSIAMFVPVKWGGVPNQHINNNVIAASKESPIIGKMIEKIARSYKEDKASELIKTKNSNGNRSFVKGKRIFGTTPRKSAVVDANSSSGQEEETTLQIGADQSRFFYLPGNKRFLPGGRLDKSLCYSGLYMCQDVLSAEFGENYFKDGDLIKQARDYFSKTPGGVALSRVPGHFDPALPSSSASGESAWWHNDNRSSYAVNGRSPYEHGMELVISKYSSLSNVVDYPTYGAKVLVRIASDKNTTPSKLREILSHPNVHPAVLLAVFKAKNATSDIRTAVLNHGEMTSDIQKAMDEDNRNNVHTLNRMQSLADGERSDLFARTTSDMIPNHRTRSLALDDFVRHHKTDSQEREILFQRCEPSEMHDQSARLTLLNALASTLDENENKEYQIISSRLAEECNGNIDKSPEQGNSVSQYPSQTDLFKTLLGKSTTRDRFQEFRILCKHVIKGDLSDQFSQELDDITVPHNIHWQWYGKEISKEKLNNALKIAHENPDFTKTIWTDDKKSIHKALQRIINDAGFTLAPDDILKTSGIEIHDPRELYSQEWEAAKTIPSVPNFGSDRNSLQEIRKNLELMQAYEGVGSLANFASKKDLNTFAILFVKGGFCLDWDADIKKSESYKENSIPLYQPVHAGLGLYQRADGVVNNDIVFATKGSSLAAGFMERSSKIYENNSKGENDDLLELERQPLFFQGKRAVKYATLKDQREAALLANVIPNAFDARRWKTLNSTGPVMMHNLLKDFDLYTDTQPVVYSPPDSIVAAPRDPLRDASWSVLPGSAQTSRIVDNPEGIFDNPKHISTGGFRKRLPMLNRIIYNPLMSDSQRKAALIPLIPGIDSTQRNNIFTCAQEMKQYEASVALLLAMIPTATQLERTEFFEATSKIPSDKLRSQLFAALVHNATPSELEMITNQATPENMPDSDARQYLCEALATYAPHPSPPPIQPRDFSGTLPQASLPTSAQSSGRAGRRGLLQLFHRDSSSRENQSAAVSDPPSAPQQPDTERMATEGDSMHVPTSRRSNLMRRVNNILRC